MMMFRRVQSRWMTLLALLWFAPSIQVAAQPALLWDAVAKDYSAKLGETNINFTFTATNLTAADIFVRAVKTSCGCTVAKLPPLPWRIASGTNGQMEVVVDIRGKRGVLSKVISVDTTGGTSLLSVTVKIPEDRNMNMQLAKADRQAVFKYDCASCHFYPTIGKKGEALYASACGICHESDHRASMVPDLKALSKPTNRLYWDTWIRKGRDGSLMPAFAKSEGGPLDDDQVASLVEYLSKNYSSLDLGNPFSGP